MIRPEAQKAISDLREVLIGVALLALGSHWVINGHTYQPFIGALLGAGGLVALWLGYRRVRFPAGEGGVGMVEVTERQIAYMTGTGGSAIAIDALTRIEVHTSRTGIVWVFTTATGETLRIPGDAAGAEALFEALVSLPGLNYDQAAQAARKASAATAGPDAYLIWQSDKRALH
ncbi:MAG: hypothetical protein AAF092_06905 [Pseudomonadota bacterium]